MSRTKELIRRLRGQQFCLLITYRKDEVEVATPMWFALKDESLFFETMGESGKVKRLRREPKVKLAPCTGSGFLLGPVLCAKARLVFDPKELEIARKALSERYGLKRRLLMWGLSFARDKTRAVIAVDLSDTWVESEKA